MKVINDLRKTLKTIGATLDEGAGYVLNCDAPSGYVWRANGCCALPIQCATNSQTWYAKAIREEMPSLKMGLEKVTDPAEIAEKRHELGDDTWGAPADAPDRIEWPTNMAAPTATAMAANCADHE